MARPPSPPPAPARGRAGTGAPSRRGRRPPLAPAPVPAQPGRLPIAPAPQAGMPDEGRRGLPDANGAPPRHADTTQVVKRLKPGQPGTQALLRRYGAALVCVRYREDLATGKTRLTTVELVVDQRPLRRQALIKVDIRFDDAETRRQALQLGAEWDATQKVWRMPRRAAIQLGLLRNQRKATK